MEPGMILMIGIIVFFYVRLYLMRRGKKRRENLHILREMKQGRKAPKMEANNPDEPYRVKSWWILVPGVLFLLLGLALYTRAFLTDLQVYWWIPGAIGGILFMFSFE